MRRSAVIAGAVLAVLAVLAVAGCGSSLTHEQQQQTCAALAVGGYDFAIGQVQKYVPVDEAAEALREATNDQCPDQLDDLP